jgi:hypothetical protein
MGYKATFHQLIYDSTLGIPVLVTKDNNKWLAGLRTGESHQQTQMVGLRCCYLSNKS